MSLEKLMERADVLLDECEMWHGHSLYFEYRASKEMMNEFWELVTKRIDEAYMEEYKAYHITHEESGEPHATYIGLCGGAVDRDAVKHAIEKLGITEGVGKWVEETLDKVEEVAKRVRKDMDSITEEFIAKYNLTYKVTDY